jgi:H+-transporting ATPase
MISRLLGIGVTGEETEGNLQIDQSSLTGESLPASKGKNAIAYSSSICKQGQMLAVVTKTGVNTYIGRAANLIAISPESGHFQKIMNRIGSFLVISTITMSFIVFLFLVYARNNKAIDALEKVIVLTIAAIPVIRFPSND